MSNLDYHYAVLELAGAVGGRLEQVYEIEDNVFRFRLSNKGEKIDLIATLGARLSASKMIPESPMQPTSFASLLRKRLGNAVIEEISQVSLDRLVMMRLRKEETCLLYFEMFAKGNLVLCDETGRILATYHEQKEAKRVVARDGQYPVPTAAASPFEAEETQKVLESENTKDAAKKIALAPAYFDDFSKGADLTDAKKAAKAMAKYVSEPQFTAYYDAEGGATGFSAVKLNDPAAYLKAEPANSREFGRFSDGLDEYYSKATISGPAKKTKNAKLEKLLKQKEIQEKSIAEALSAADVLQAFGDAIYLHYDKVENAIEKAKKERKNKIEMEV
jgi:predicted ribosome quality control (RQC) complex YloA/Tae2 family protein